MRRRQEPIPDLAQLLEPDSTPRGDFEFAPTVSMREVETPLAFPIPPASADAPVTTHLRLSLSRVRHAFRRSVDEMRELWAGTGEVVDGAPTSNAASRLLFVALRARALWSFWEWDRRDVVRAGIIGTAVFFTAAMLGASLLGREDAQHDADATASANAEVRAPRTLDQHTGMRGAVRTKVR